MQTSTRFEDACIYATRLHINQRRKGTDIPYIAHLLGVASIVLENGGDEDETIAALLHDAVEDQGGTKTRLEIQQHFGDTVSNIIDGCTHDNTISSWQARKETHIAHMRTASHSVRLVLAADKLHNARSILRDYYALGDNLWQRFHGGKTGTLWYYRTVVDVLQEKGSFPLLKELEAMVKEIEIATK